MRLEADRGVEAEILDLLYRYSARTGAARDRAVVGVVLADEQLRIHIDVVGPTGSLHIEVERMCRQSALNQLEAGVDRAADGSRARREALQDVAADLDEALIVDYATCLGHLPRRRRLRSTGGPRVRDVVCVTHRLWGDADWAGPGHIDLDLDPDILRRGCAF